MDWRNPSTVVNLVSACLLAWLLQLILYSPISPSANFLLSDYKREGPFAENIVLQSVEKLGEGLLEGTEDSAVDSNGIIYAATKKGWIKRMHANGLWEDWKKIGGFPLGLTVSMSGHIIVCDPSRGLLEVSNEGVVTLVSEIEGIKIRFVEASDGSIYFSDASSKFPYSRWILDVLEGVPYGHLLKYDPKTKRTSVALDSLGHANRVALFAHKIMWPFVKHGSKYSVYQMKLRTKGLDFVYRYPILSRIFSRNPTILKWFGVVKGAMVGKIGEDGRPIKSFGDTSGKVMSLVKSAMEVGEYLYVGSLNTNFLGRLNLNKFR